MTNWKASGRLQIPGDVCVCLSDQGSLTISFYEDDSDFNGNDFEYRYSLDAESTELFLKKIPHRNDDAKKDVGEWLKENVKCDGFGYDLLEMWSRMGLHGSHLVREDFPGGIYREQAF